MKIRLPSHLQSPSASLAAIQATETMSAMPTFPRNDEGISQPKSFFTDRREHILAAERKHTVSLMKPRIFIGSSGKAKKYAEAVHASLTDVAECTEWTQGAFGLSSSTLNNLLSDLQDSDFGAFIFAADDQLNSNGDLLNVPRDNVVFEAGLFCGYLSPTRCFIAIPQSVKIHIPSDLLGFTVGHYEDQRTDRNTMAAVGPFAHKMREAIEVQGLFKGTPADKLRDLVTQFECCNWIPKDSSPGNPWALRVERKKQVWAQLNDFCSKNRVNKHRLLAGNSGGHYIALIAAIRNHPESNDCDLIRQMDVAHLPTGFAQDKLMDSVESVKASRTCESAQLATLSAWLKTNLRDPSPPTLDRIAKLSTP